jgi:hypothetical protein
MMLVVDRRRDSVPDQRSPRGSPQVPPAAAVGYHLVTAKTPVSSPKTGSRTSADQAM